MKQIIYLAGGCFWGVQGYFDLLHGVLQTQVGYANSCIESPSYELVCSGITNAAEAVEIIFDSKIVSLEQILKHFFHIIDPFALNYQGNDFGTQYRSGIYAHDCMLLESIKVFVQNLQKGFQEMIVTEILKLENFYPAEIYHQKYLEKNPQGYCHIDLRGALRKL